MPIIFKYNTKIHCYDVINICSYMKPLFQIMYCFYINIYILNSKGQIIYETLAFGDHPVSF